MKKFFCPSCGEKESTKKEADCYSCNINRSSESEHKRWVRTQERKEPPTIPTISAILSIRHSRGRGNPGVTNSFFPFLMYYIYILASSKNGTLYIGVTNDLIRRVWEHKNNLAEGFTKKYGIHTLVYYETAENSAAAIEREKQMKKWNRYWKIKLVEEKNTEWRDLYEEII